MQTTDNGDGTYTHTLEPGDMAEAILRRVRAERFDYNGATQRAIDPHRAHKHPFRWRLMQFRRQLKQFRRRWER